MITFIRKSSRHVKIQEEWFRMVIGGKRHTIHRSCYLFKTDEAGNLYPYLVLEDAVKKSKYLVRIWRHRRKK